MPIPSLKLKATYHDGQLLGVAVGPRHEVVLTIRLDPVWDNGDATNRRVRFAKIKNFEEVSAFFARLPRPTPPQDSLGEVIAIVRPTKGTIGVDLAPAGYIEMKGATVEEL